MRRRSIKPVMLWVAITVGAALVSHRGLTVEPGEELIQKKEGHRLPPRVVSPTADRVARLQVPSGFEVSVFARGLGRPRMMAVGQDGTVYVTRRDRGDVLGVIDGDGDGQADGTRAVVEGLQGVHGVAIHGDTLYLATARVVYIARLKEGAVGQPRKLFAGLPPGGRHPNRTLAVGPDGKLYVTVGSTCNCCIEAHDKSATIIRSNLDGSGVEIFATGLRNTLGFGWHPVSKAMYGMDHGSDWLGDDFPPEELNRLERGHHYGWPFVYGKQQVIDLQAYPASFSRERALARSTPSVLEYRAHSAPLQMVFYTAEQFPRAYRNDAFVAMHGSWNRKPPSGYEVVRVHFGADGKPRRFEPFLTGFKLPKGRRVFGRPTGLAVARDGALLVGCDATGVIYRVAYPGRRGAAR